MPAERPSLPTPTSTFSGSLLPRRARYGESLIDWWVVFTDYDWREEDSRRHGGWWQPWRLLTRPGFRHCFALRAQQGVWTEVNSHVCNTDVTVLPTDAYPNLPYDMARRGNCHIIQVIRYRGLQYIRRGLRGQFNCVTLTKHLLGIDASWVLTPHALYKFLIKEGHVEIETQ